ncbi:MAG: sigma-54 dependent transcriptional regulator, partial [Porphyromonas sp.]|nr:sigma-54 dependent transcriptional regulator [Porphyromonas sp.]
NIIGQSTAMQELLQTVARIAPTTASVLITGESGTGKELIAEAIHRLSKRNSEPFVKVNLGGIPQNLFESEMFGHKKGAFTDAYTDRKGRFLLADKGTIFLDEIGDLDASCQVKLLRVLQDQSFEVLGESQPRRVDVRVVSATNADLRQKVQEGTFREDLFFRINLIHLHLPALRERPDDIPLLVNHFVKQSGRDVQFTDEAISRLQSLPFSGNIRELKNLVERTILMSNSDTITPQLLTPFLLPDKTNPRPQPEVTDHRTLEEMECDEIKRQLVIHRGNMSKVAKALGISRAALYRRIDKYGL